MISWQLTTFALALLCALAGTMVGGSHVPAENATRSHPGLLQVPANRVLSKWRGLALGSGLLTGGALATYLATAAVNHRSHKAGTHGLNWLQKIPIGKGVAGIVERVQRMEKGQSAAGLLACGKCNCSIGKALGRAMIIEKALVTDTPDSDTVTALCNLRKGSGSVHEWMLRHLEERADPRLLRNAANVLSRRDGRANRKVAQRLRKVAVQKSRYAFRGRGK